MSRRFQAKAIAKLHATRFAHASSHATVFGQQTRVFGMEAPTGTKRELPPAQRIDPSFDCSEVVELSPDKDNPGCYPVSAAMRRHIEQSN